MLRGPFGQGGQLCLLWDAGEPAGLQEQLKSRGSDLRGLPRARCKPPWMLCLGFTLKGSINLIVTSSSGGREASVLLVGGGGVTQLQHSLLALETASFPNLMREHVRHRGVLWHTRLPLKASCS